MSAVIVHGFELLQALSIEILVEAEGGSAGAGVVQIRHTAAYGQEADFQMIVSQKRRQFLIECLAKISHGLHLIGID